MAFVSGLIGLPEFREAATHPDNAGAERLIVRGEGANAIIVAANDGNRDENIRIIDHLRTALQAEHTSENANAFIATEIGQLARIGGTSSRLSTARLQRILARADDLRRATASNEVKESERSITATSSATVVEKAPSVKRGASVKTPDLVFQAFAAFLRWKKNECLPFNTDTKMPGKYFQLSQEFPIAERLVAYIEECYRNSENKEHPIPLNSFHLAAIDRMEEALRLRVEATRQTYDNTRTRFLSVASSKEKAAACIIKALVTQRQSAGVYWMAGTAQKLLCDAQEYPIKALEHYLLIKVREAVENQKNTLAALWIEAAKSSHAQKSVSNAKEDPVKTLQHYLLSKAREAALNKKNALTALWIESARSLHVQSLRAQKLASNAEERLVEALKHDLWIKAAEAMENQKEALAILCVQAAQSISVSENRLLSKEAKIKT
ncbi:MAG: hypothetical protein ACH346_08740 [Chthoniobacterales bacterium]